MPLHDWTTVESGVYHSFHVQWIGTITAKLNSILPASYYAMAERTVEDTIPDVIGFHDGNWDFDDSPKSGGVATLARPKKQFVISSATEAEAYTRKANRIAVKTTRHKVVAVIELVSPGNKDAKKRLKAFVQKTVDFLRDGVNVLVVDPFPPGRRDPQGLHPLIWEDFVDDSFTLPRGKPYTFASYQTSPRLTAYIEPIKLGEDLPEMPLFLKRDFYVNVPLEETYAATIAVVPKLLRPA